MGIRSRISGAVKKVVSTGKDVVVGGAKAVQSGVGIVTKAVTSRFKDSSVSAPSGGTSGGGKTVSPSQSVSSKTVGQPVQSLASGGVLTDQGFVITQEQANQIMKEPPVKIPTGGGGIKQIPTRTTPTEERLRMSLPSELRFLPPEEVIKRQSILSRGIGEVGRVEQLQKQQQERLRTPPKPPQLTSAQSYVKQGFSQSKAQILASEGAKRRMSFSKEGAEQVLKEITVPKVKFDLQKGFYEEQVVPSPRAEKVVQSIEKTKELAKKGIGEVFGLAKTGFEVISGKETGVPLVTGAGEVQTALDVLNQNKVGIQNKLDTIRTGARNIFLSPEEKELNKELNKAEKDAVDTAEDVNKKTEAYNSKVEKFNNDIASGKITGDKAGLKLADQLNRDAKNIEKEQTEAENKIDYYNGVVEKAKEAEPAGLTRFGVGVAKGAVSLPFDISSIALGVVTEPGKTAKQLAMLPMTIPEQLVEDPFGFGGELVGQAVTATAAVRAASAGIRAATTRANTVSKISKLKTDIAVDIDVADSVNIGTDAFGNSQFKLNAEVVTKLINRKTGKVLETVRTDHFSDVVTARDAEGAIRAYSKGIAESLRKYGIRKYVKQPKVTITKDLKSATTRAVLRPSKIEDVYTGTFESEILEAGKKMAKAKPIYAQDLGFADVIISKDVFKKVGKRVPTKATGLGQIMVKAGKPHLKIRRFGDVLTGGIETFDFSKALTDLTKETFGVKGYKRKIPRPQKIGLFKDISTTIKPFKPLKAPPVRPRGLIDILRGRPTQRIKAQARKFPTEQKALRDISQGVTRTFFPKQGLIDLSGFEFKRAGAKGRISKELPKEIDSNLITKNIQEQLLGTGVKQKLAAAKGVVRAEAQQVGRVIGEEIKTKAERRARVKAERDVKRQTQKQQEKLLGADKELARLWAGTTPVFKGLKKQREVSKAKQKEEQLGSLFGITPLVNLRDLTRVVDIQKTNQTQALATLQTQQQVFSPFAGIVPTVGVPRVPKPPKKPRIIIPPLFKDEGRMFIDKNANKPHDVFIREGGKYRKITKQPLSNKAEAKDVGSWVTDNTLSAEFVVRPSKKKPGAFPFNPPPNYWELTKPKFREFRQRRGQIIPLVNTFIEGKEYRLDTNPEVRKITAARFLAEQNKRTQELKRYNKGFSSMFGFPANNNGKILKQKGLNNLFGFNF